MKHYTNKKTLEVYGYESPEDAQAFNDDFDNLVEMTVELFQEYREQKPGHKWTLSGWVEDEDLMRELKRAEEYQAKLELNNKIAELKLQLQVHLLMGEEEEAKALVLEIRALQK